MNAVVQFDQPLVGQLQRPDEYLLFDDSKMKQIISVANIMVTGKTTVPKHLQGSLGDCMAVCLQAAQWRLNPFAVAQKTHLVNGFLGYEAQLVIAVINTQAPIQGRLKFSWEGEWDGVKGKSCVDNDKAVVVSATFIGDSEPTLLRVSMAQVGGVRNSPLWDSDPRQQLAYLAAKRWARVYCPEVVLGIYTPDEIEEIPNGGVVTTGPAKPAAGVAGLKARLQPVAQVEPVAVNAPSAETKQDDINGLLAAIAASKTMEELKALKEIAASLKGEQKKMAVAALKEQFAIIDPAGSISTAIAAATSPADLEALIPQFDKVPEDQFEALYAQYSVKMESLGPPVTELKA